MLTASCRGFIIPPMTPDRATVQIEDSPIPNFGKDLEDSLKAKVGPDGLRVIQRRFQLKGGKNRPDHHGTPSARRAYDRTVMLENLQRMKNASDERLANATIFESLLDEEPVDDGTTELFQE